jgi:methylmalonyl-CoA mutase C-terminal domain/subunit
VTAVLSELRLRNASDVRVFVGGTIPAQDHAPLRALGVAAVFTADMALDAVVRELAEQFA